ncbi:NAD(P)(+)-binding domain-containing protein (plasmid) [Rhizobium etli bv. mimosae str. Mim1]|nr:NAD(P)(+)-binding domain-containing protein [Rhizobium etli bv. mimosae str. Mim1]
MFPRKMHAAGDASSGKSAAAERDLEGGRPGHPIVKTCSGVVTGTGGLAHEDTLASARAGTSVLTAGRNSPKGAAAVTTVRHAEPGADVRFGLLDFANLKSIACCAVCAGSGRH